MHLDTTVSRVCPEQGSVEGVVTRLPTAPCQCSRMNPDSRKNCGFPGITSDQCFAAGCCFDTTVPGVPWCFIPLPMQGNPRAAGPLPVPQPSAQAPANGAGDRCPGPPTGTENPPSPVSTPGPTCQPLPLWQTHVGARVCTEPASLCLKKTTALGPLLP